MPASVLIALGSNLGDRALFLRRAISSLSAVIHVVRVSSFIETDPVDAPPPKYLNAVVAGYTDLSPSVLLDTLHEIESRLGRRRSTRNAPRVIDLDLILHSANLVHTRTLTVPHPRYLRREFVLGPLRELKLDWRDPATGTALIFTTVPSITSTDKSVWAT
ncbi:MAG: 2-amino-4-hydroxy-6-hydroxymethyldihydropteridine diphosphokinase [Thermoanaerobaculia bacterium]|nr:2-amino-4-hydroxy-6-hydroxymethyldihydropteridine diphosphokinase [Thermoanaerobaculia bacterium]